MHLHALAFAVLIGLSGASAAQAVTLKAFNGTLLWSGVLPGRLAAMAPMEGGPPFTRLPRAAEVREPLAAFATVLATLDRPKLRGGAIGPVQLARFPAWFGTSAPPFRPRTAAAPVPRSSAAQEPVPVPAAAALPLILSALGVLSLAARRRR